MHTILNEAAVQLLTIAPDDRARLAGVRELLGTAGSDAPVPDWAAGALASALALLDDAVAGAVPQDNAVARVCALLELLQHGGAAAGTGTAPDDGAAERSWLPTESARELVPEFVAECLEFFEQAEGALLVLSSKPADREALNIVLRAFHTAKSSAAFLGMKPISELAHNAESLLCRVRDDGLEFTDAHTELALECIDVMRALIGQAHSAADGGGFALPDNYSALLQRLTATALADVEPQAADAAAARSVDAAPRSPSRADAAAGAGGAPHDEADGWIRLRTARLDQLVDLVGELVVAQSMVAQDPAVERERHDDLGRKVSHAGKLVRELHELGVALRMVPLRPLFHRLQLLVRQLAKESGKQVELVLAGADTEIDRTMVEQLTDPLVHMIRNAIDHGLEPAAERSALGKDPTGTLQLTAYHAGGSVVIELRDDGRGLDHDRILARAVDRGLVEPDRELTPADVYLLIFSPGLSTADSVTALSGRGVGMDVVRRNVEALHGRIEIDAERGRGTTFTMRFPLTLAITDGMLVHVGMERYIIPTAHIRMSFRPAAHALTAAPGGGEMVSLHGDVMPIIRLHALFGVAGAITDPTEGLLVVVAAGDRRYALLVDELVRQQQFVAKSMGGGLGTVPGVAGGAILGDGQVGLIIDTAGVISHWSA